MEAPHDADKLISANKKLIDALPDLMDRAIELCKGVTVSQHMGPNSPPAVYTRAPDGTMLSYLMDRALGKPAVEVNDTDERLNTARAVYIEEQVIEGIISAQARDLTARASRAEIEARMWPLQFVTEEDQERKLQELAHAANRPLLNLTPEAFAAMVPGCTDPAAALERLRGELGREQAVIFEEVMSGSREVADEEEDESEDED